MSYAGYSGYSGFDGFGGYDGLGDSYVSTLIGGIGDQIHTEARNAAKGQGVPYEIFDTYDNIARGALTQDAATLRNNFVGATMQLGQKYGSQAIANATGIPVGAVSNIIGGIMGGSVSATDVATVAGGVVGLAVCGPPCAAIGATVGALVVAVVGGIVEGLKDLFGANNKERAEHERALRAARDAIQSGVVERMNEYTATYFFSVANIYNRMLLIPNGFGVDDSMVMPSKVSGKIPVVQNALASVRGDRYLYRQQNGDKQPEQVVLLPARAAFAGAVYAAVQQHFGNIAIRGADESGYNEVRRQAGIVSGVGQVPRSLLPLRADGKTPVFCSFAQIGIPQCDASDAPLGGFEALGISGQANVTASASAAAAAQAQAAQKAQQEKARLNSMCGATEYMIALWQCNADENRPGFLQWYHDTMDYVASNWMAIAARDCAVITYQQKIKEAGAVMLQTIQQVAQQQFATDGQRQVALITAQANTQKALVQQSVAQTTVIRKVAAAQKGMTPQQKKALAIGAAGVGVGGALLILL